MRVVEAVVNVALAAVLFWPLRRDLASIFRGAPRRYLAIVIVFLAMLVGGQGLARSTGAYPLSEWDMHTVPVTADPELVDYTVVRSDGVEERLLIGRLFPAVGRQLRSRIDRVARAADSPDPATAAAAEQALGAMLATIGRRYAADHPGVRVLSIRLWVRTIPALDYRGPDSITRRLTREYRLPPAS
jgi:hypothetical protein